jgi:hypothetical protein
MRSQNVLDLLDYEAKRHPELAAMMANIDRMSDADIKAAKVRLPWMRQALLRFKHEHPSEELIAQVLAVVIDSQVPDPIGEMRQWAGPNTFIRVGRSQLEICTGQLVWFGQTGVWIDTIHSTLIDSKLRSSTMSCGQISRGGYMEAVRACTNKLHVLETTSSSEPAIRFYRPA